MPQYNTALHITHDDLARIWRRHGLGEVRHVSRIERGIVNATFVINDSHVVRFDGLPPPAEGRHRYFAEQTAYALLRERGLPVPEVLALEPASQGETPAYIVMTRLSGGAVIDGWATLDAAQRRQVARQAGEALAAMHGITLPRFGKLRDLDRLGFDGWFDYVADFLNRYTERGLAVQALDMALTARLWDALEALRPGLESVRQGVLVHGDYHWENLLQHEGALSGMIDFELSISGDPAMDFAVAEQWEDECPGSREHIYATYTAQRALEADHAPRSHFYWLLRVLDYTVESLEEGDVAGQRVGQTTLLDGLARLDALLG